MRLRNKMKEGAATQPCPLSAFSLVCFANADIQGFWIKKPKNQSITDAQDECRNLQYD